MLPADSQGLGECDSGLPAVSVPRIMCVMSTKRGRPGPFSLDWLLHADIARMLRGAQPAHDEDCHSSRQTWLAQHGQPDARRLVQRTRPTPPGQDPGAFAPAPDVPNPVMQAAQHFWEVAQAEARRDVDERITAGLPSGVPRSSEALPLPYSAPAGNSSMPSFPAVVDRVEFTARAAAAGGLAVAASRRLWHLATGWATQRA